MLLISILEQRFFFIYVTNVTKQDRYHSGTEKNSHQDCFNKQSVTPRYRDRVTKSARERKQDRYQSGTEKNSHQDCFNKQSVTRRDRDRVTKSARERKQDRDQSRSHGHG